MDVKVFSKSQILGGLSGSDADMQRRNWLLGASDTKSSFAGVFTRRRMDNITSQPWRWHDDEEVEFIFAGRMHVQIGDESGEVSMEFEAGAGDLFYIGAGVKHRADSVGDDLCVGVLFCPTAYPIPPGQTSHSDAQ